MIYFIQSLDTVKVGYTKNLTLRVNGLRTANPHGLIVIGTVKGDKNAEQAIHKKLDKYRVAGEWFKNCNEVRSCVDKILSGKIKFKYDRMIFRRDEFGELHSEKETITLDDPKLLNMWKEYNHSKNGILHGITKELKGIQGQINMLLAKKQSLERKYIKTVKEK